MIYYLIFTPSEPFALPIWLKVPSFHGLFTTEWKRRGNGESRKCHQKESENYDVRIMMMAVLVIGERTNEGITRIWYRNARANLLTRTSSAYTFSDMRWSWLATRSHFVFYFYQARLFTIWWKYWISSPPAWTASALSNSSALQQKQ